MTRLPAQITECRCSQDESKHKGGRCPANPDTSFRHPSIGRIHNCRDFAEYVPRQQFPDFFVAVHAVVQELKCARNKDPQCQTNSKSHAAEFKAVGELRPLWKTRRIHHPETLSL